MSSGVEWAVAGSASLANIAGFGHLAKMSNLSIVRRPIQDREKGRHSRISHLAGAIMLTLLAACSRPTHDQATLNAIKVESENLMRMRQAGRYAKIPRDEWPKVIASLGPEDVTVYAYGVEITTKRFFDGGWGYFVSRETDRSPEPKDRFSKLSPGVYWYHPY
jgi:hypothetical protein